MPDRAGRLDPVVVMVVVPVVAVAAMVPVVARPVAPVVAVADELVVFAVRLAEQLDVVHGHGAGGGRRQGQVGGREGENRDREEQELAEHWDLKGGRGCSAPPGCLLATPHAGEFGVLTVPLTSTPQSQPLVAKPDSAAKIFSALGPPSLASSAEGRPFGITLANLVYRWAGMLLSEAGKLVGALPPHTANGKPHAAFLTAAPPGATIGG
jgi:hypothetical protein